MNNEIRHHGILGMKWGVRRFQNKDGTLTNAGKRRYDSKMSDKTVQEHEDYQKAHSQRNVREMSDKELRERLSRLQMEKQYKDLSEKRVAVGKSYVKRAITAMTTAATVTTTAINLYNNTDKIKRIMNEASLNRMQLKLK